MWIYFLISGLAGLAYWALLHYYTYVWKKLPEEQLPENFVPQTSVSILIAARNESENIEACLAAIAAQEYPKTHWECIVIDDHSEDDTHQKLTDYQQVMPNLKVLALADYLKAKRLDTQAYKKQALSYGLSEAQGTLMVTTDADCVMGPRWLTYLVAKYEATSAQFIAAPVQFYKEKTFVQRFQSLDFTGLMGVTAAGIQTRTNYMANGANLAYPKAAFEQVGGFAQVTHKTEIASGDDVFLLQKIAATAPHRIHFVKHPEASTYTKAQPTWAALLNQRVRWASKSTKYDNKNSQIVALLVAGCGLSIFLDILVVWWLVAWPWALLWLVIKLLLKGHGEFALLHATTRFFGRADLQRLRFLSVFVHTYYLWAVTGRVLTATSYTWKTRKVSTK